LITKTIAIPQMRNQQDADKVSRALQEVWGIKSAEVSWERQEATVHFDELAASFHDFQEALLESGYEIRTPEGQRLESMHDWRLDE
jgi:copper chaperone CopZ